MSLQSQLFQGDAKLEAAAVSDPAHIAPGASGEHVGKIQIALLQLDGAIIDGADLQGLRYGASTGNAVLAYKRKRKIINTTYQTQADNITGRMTIAALDKEMLAREKSDPDADFVGFTTEQKEMVKADLLRSKAMLDVVNRRLQVVSHTSPSGGLVITPRNVDLYDTKLKILSVFRINSFTDDDFPIPPEVLPQIRQRFPVLAGVPGPTGSPSDAINAAVLVQNYRVLRTSMDQRFTKLFYTQGTFKGQPLGFFAAFVDATDPSDTTVRITRRYFDLQIMPTRDDRAVTLAHERAHTVFRANGHPGTGDNPFCVAPHLGDPNVKTADQALKNAYCYEWLIDSLQPGYVAARFRGPECAVTR